MDIYFEGFVYSDAVFPNNQFIGNQFAYTTKRKIMSTSFSNNPHLVRGLRDNNPGNIRPNQHDHWIGQVGVENNYVIFQDIEHGIRAMAKDIKSKINGHGWDTIAKYIPAYAPPEDHNNTEGYIQRVCNSTGFKRDEILRADFATLVKLVKAHIQVELGNDAHMITDTMINDGVLMAI